MKIPKFLSILLMFFILSASCLFFLLRGSCPILSGHKNLKGLDQELVIERDQYGIPTIKGYSRLDVARATGFLHAQDRFFQMDLMRRAAAGELSELFGEAAIEFDKERRIHGFRKQAKRILSLLTPFEQNLLKGYTEGVNAGLNTLSCRPFEYFILRQKPAAWIEEDSVLVGLGLFFDLQDPLGSVDWVRGVLKEYLPDHVFEFLTQNGSNWDSALDGSSISFIQIPEEKHFEYLQNICNNVHNETNQNFYPLTKGSNQWAINASLSETGKAVLACDMHLNLSAPNIWYRLAFDYHDHKGKNIQVSGVSLPGTPLIAVGSNRHIAWGFTNAYVDTTDLVLLDIDPSNPDFYLTPEGAHPFEKKMEEIKVHGNCSIFYEIPWTKWGPVHSKKFLGKSVAIRWIAHDDDCFNFRLIDLENAQSTQIAIKSLYDIHLPVLNFMVADSDGHIGWSLVGGIPKRSGYEPGVPVSFTKGDCKWIGRLDQNEYPSLIDPSYNCLWTANNRVINCPAFGKDYLNSIRAHQIKMRLTESKQHSLASMHAIQLDDEAFFFDRWFHLLVKHLNLQDSRHKQLYSIINAWDHHCSSSSKEYFWIRTFREKVIESIANHVLSPCLMAYPDLNYHLLDLEEPMFLIASQQPDYLINPQIGSWKGQLTKIIDGMLNENLQHLAKQTSWGNFNVSSIQHPLSFGLSALGFFLDMPKKSLAGDYYVPLVSSPTDGASVRLVVTPGHEEEGILNVPCGQSGHPLSKHYRDQHEAWLEGKPASFLPGPTVHRLYLLP